VLAKMRQQQAKFQIRRHENDFLDRSLLSHNRERQASAYRAAANRITTILPTSTSLEQRSLTVIFLYRLLKRAWRHVTLEFGYDGLSK